MISPEQSLCGVGIWTVTEYRSVCYFTVKAVLLYRSLDAGLGHRASSNFVCKTSKLFHASDVTRHLTGKDVNKIWKPDWGRLLKTFRLLISGLYLLCFNVSMYFLFPLLRFFKAQYIGFCVTGAWIVLASYTCREMYYLLFTVVLTFTGTSNASAVFLFNMFVSF